MSELEKLCRMLEAVARDARQWASSLDQESMKIHSHLQKLSAAAQKSKRPGTAQALASLENAQKRVRDASRQMQMVSAGAKAWVAAALAAGGGNSGGGGGGTGSGSDGSVESFIKNHVHPNFQSQVKNSFADDSKVTELAEDTTAFRYHGGMSNKKGHWYTPNQTDNPAADLALPPGNTYEHMDTVVIPKGTTILEGTVASDFGQPGGGHQYYVPDPSTVILE